MKIIKLGSIVKDNATGLKGMLTHFEVQHGGNQFYLFQPRGLNPEDGQPVKRLWLAPARISGAVADHTVDDLPIVILGTEATDTASGFSGTVISVQLHISGCVHATLQPSGKLAKTGAAIEHDNFDIRRLTGPAIKKLTEAERDEDQRRRPSPSETPRSGPRMPTT